MRTSSVIHTTPTYVRQIANATTKFTVSELSYYSGARRYCGQLQQMLRVRVGHTTSTTAVSKKASRSRTGYCRCATRWLWVGRLPGDLVQALLIRYDPGAVSAGTEAGRLSSMSSTCHSATPRRGGSASGPARASNGSRCWPNRGRCIDYQARRGRTGSTVLPTWRCRGGRSSGPVAGDTAPRVWARQAFGLKNIRRASSSCRSNFAVWYWAGETASEVSLNGSSSMQISEMRPAKSFS